jgi:predicted 3-demethylubiquinone-9 3-methyltransferase (glyoxalase superfamily)
MADRISSSAKAISFQIHCETQDEIDTYWSKLTAGGGQESHCGWLKDKFGLSWQVVSAVLIEMLSGGDAAKSQRVTKAFLRMNKFDIAALQSA